MEQITLYHSGTKFTEAFRPGIQRVNEGANRKASFYQQACDVATSGPLSPARHTSD